MTRELHRLYRLKENNKLDLLSTELETQKSNFEQNCSQLASCESIIELALAQIESCDLDDESKRQLSQTISDLEAILANETNYPLMLKKYQALASMLRAVFIDTTVDVNGKGEALDSFLSTLKLPSTEAESKATLCIIVGLLASILVLCVALHFVLPLIPFAAALSWIGLGAGWLPVVGGMAEVGSILLGAYIFTKITERLIDPLSNLLQEHSDEYAAATSVENCVSTLSFFAPAKKTSYDTRLVEQQDFPSLEKI